MGEVGKFYDHLGNDSWYYFVYGQTNRKAELNRAVSRACGTSVYGDVAVIRSGSAGYDTPEVFTRTVLDKALKYYETGNAREIFAEREKSRVSRSMGIDLSGVPHININ